MNAHARSESRHRRTYVALWALAAVAFAGLTVAGRPVAAAVVFAACGAGAVALHARYGRTAPLFDERDATVVQQASANTLAVVGIASAVVFPTLTAAVALDLAAWPAWLSPVAVGVAGLFALWAVMLVVARRQA